MLKAGVVGVGHLGRFHAQKYSDIENVELVGVYDIDPDRAKLVAKECRTKAYSDMSELFKDVDIVSIASPATTHFNVADIAISNGIHCLIEKPFTRTVGEAKKLMDLAKDRGVKIQIGHLERFNTVTSVGYSLLKNPRFIECHRLTPFTARSTDIDVILDLMIHDIDLVIGIMGSDVTEIDAVGVPVLTDKVDIAHAKLIFGSGTMANFTASRISQKVFRKMRIFQRYSYIGLDFGKSEIEIFERVGEEGQYSISGRTLPLGGSTDTLKKEIESFISSVYEDTEPVVTAKSALDALGIAHRIISKINERMDIL